MFDKISNLLNVNALWTTCDKTRKELRCETDLSCYKKSYWQYEIDIHDGTVCDRYKFSNCGCGVIT